MKVSFEERKKSQFYALKTINDCLYFVDLTEILLIFKVFSITENAENQVWK